MLIFSKLNFWFFYFVLKMNFIFNQIFKQGSAVETDRCGGPDSGTWECLYGNSNSLSGEVPADRPEVLAEIGLGCRCGCIVHLGVVKPRKLIASSSHSCPGRTFWLIQVFWIRFFFFFCKII